MENMTTKSGFIAIVGRPNVGKSSLLNAMVGAKVAIVSDKPQTTRTRITGVLTQGETQLVFIDTPGLHKPRTSLGRFMVRQVSESVADVDAAVFVVEANGPLTNAEEQLIENFRQRQAPVVAVLNKIDQCKDKSLIITKMALLAEKYNFDQIVPISALTGEGVDLLVDLLKNYALPGPHYFDDNTLTDQPERVLVSEVIREKLLRNMRDEIPHGTAVVVESMTEREGSGMLDIHAIIYCERENHKGMIIGKGGNMLKTVATQAREELELFFATKVNLQCWVKVKEDWRNKDQILRSLGYYD